MTLTASGGMSLTANLRQSRIPVLTYIIQKQHLHPPIPQNANPHAWTYICKNRRYPNNMTRDANKKNENKTIPTKKNPRNKVWRADPKELRKELGRKRQYVYYLTQKSQTTLSNKCKYTTQCRMRKSGRLHRESKTSRSNTDDNNAQNTHCGNRTHIPWDSPYRRDGYRIITYAARKYSMDTIKTKRKDYMYGGVAMLVSEEIQQHIGSIRRIDHRIMQVALTKRTETIPTAIIATYAQIIWYTQSKTSTLRSSERNAIANT